MNKKRPGIGVLLVAISLVSAVASATTTATPAEHYLAIQEALAGDSLDLVPEHAAALQELATAMKDNSSKGEHPSGAAIAAAAERLTRATEIKEARLAFGDLSELLIRAGDLVPTDDLKVAYCSMADEHWLQTGDQIANPYYGASMLRCGGFVEQPGTTPGK